MYQKFGVPREDNAKRNCRYKSSLMSNRSDRGMPDQNKIDVM